MQEKQIFLDGSDMTEKIGEQIGRSLRGGECFELKSDLGGGKTTFTRGLVRGMGSLDNVSSPTFTIGKQYKINDMTCYHFDFYRLQDAGIVAEELAEAVSDPKGVIVVEWAETVSEVLPSDRIIVEFHRVPDNSETREFVVTYPESTAYLFEAF